MKSNLLTRWLLILLLVLFALLSYFTISKTASSPTLYRSTIESLDAKRTTIMELTAGASAASVAVAAIPGDATTPIANELAQLNSFFVISLCAVLLEKYLLTTLGYGVFRFLIPGACALCALGLLIRNRSLRAVGIKIALVGVLLVSVVPASVYVADLIDNTYTVSSLMDVDVSDLEEATQSVILEEESFLEEAEPAEKQSFWNAILNGINRLEESVSTAVQNTAASITEAAEKAKQQAEQTLNHFVEALAVMIVTTCLIPLLTLSFFLWLLQTISGIQFTRPFDLPRHHRGHHHHDHETAAE